MNNAFVQLPCYAGDVSGACSALYELGGMVVIHDPSGCSSTYNTHDETRWYDQDSMIYLSGFTERDAVLGRDDKLTAEVAAAAQSLGPAFVALLSSPVPYLNGTDLPALARVIERETGIPAFFVPTNGMRDYTRGAGGAFAALARRFVRPAAARRPRTVNLLGVTPLDFAADGAAQSLRAAAQRAGWEVLSCWAMGSDLAALARAGGAAANLVVSCTGLAAARVLQARFGTPWVAAAPVGAFAPAVWAALDAAARDGQSRTPYLAHAAQEQEQVQEQAQTRGGAAVFVGEPVLMGSLAAAARLRGADARVLCPLAADAALLGPCDARVRGEDALRAALADASAVIADPMYRPVAPPGARFYPLPQLAFSGRSFLRDMRDVFAPDFTERTFFDELE